MIGIIIVSYKSFEQTIKYVRNELTKVKAPHRTVVVNVGSDRASSDKLESELGDLCHVFHSEENLGYARGNNLGADYLLKLCPEIDQLLFSNDDIEFLSDDVVEVLSQRLNEMPEVGCIGPKIFDLKDNLQGPGYRRPAIGYYIRRNIGEPIFGSKRYWHDEDLPRIAEAVHIVSGCFNMVRVSSFKQVGGFDPRTFLYWEEEILSARLEKIGQKVYFEPAVAIRHYVGNTTSSAPNLLLLRSELFGQRLYFREYAKASFFMRFLLGASAKIRLFLVHLACLKRACKKLLKK